MTEIGKIGMVLKWEHQYLFIDSIQVLVEDIITQSVWLSSNYENTQWFSTFSSRLPRRYSEQSSSGKPPAIPPSTLKGIHTPD